MYTKFKMSDEVTKMSNEVTKLTEEVTKLNDEVTRLNSEVARLEKELDLKIVEVMEYRERETEQHKTIEGTMNVSWLV